MNEDKNTKIYDLNEGTLETIKARPVKLKDNYKFFNRGILFKITSVITIVFIKFFWEYLIARPFFGFRVKNRKHYRALKKEGYVVVCNHIHPFDTFMIGTTLLPKKMYALMRESNLGVPIFGKIMRFAGGVPIPTRSDLFVKLLKQVPKQIDQGRSILMMPETALRPYYVGIRPFSSGAFRIAINAKSKILPAVYVYKKPRFIMKWLKKKPYFQLHFLPAVTVIKQSTNHETIEHYKNHIHDMMIQYYNQHSEIK